MTRKLLVGAIVAGALTVTAGTALALSQDDPSSSGAAPTTTSTTSTSTSARTTSPATSSTTSSSSPTSTTSTSSGSAPAELSADDAANLVRERMGGTVHEVEREVEHGRLEWKVEITARDGVTYDVRVDAVTGDVTRVDQDRDDDRDDDGDDDRDDDRDDDGKGRHGGDDRDDHRDHDEDD